MSKMIDSEKLIAEIEETRIKPCTDTNTASYNIGISKAIDLIRKHQPEPQGVEEYQGQLRENITYALIDSANKLENVDDDNVWEITDSIMSTISPYLQTNTTELEKVREALSLALSNNDGGEINSSNYNHDEVCDLNDRYVGLFMEVEQSLTIINRMLGKD